jgi:hypothetical protein
MIFYGKNIYATKFSGTSIHLAIIASTGFEPSL